MAGFNTIQNGKSHDAFEWYNRSSSKVDTAMKKFILRSSLLLIVLFIVFIGPWPISDKYYLTTDYAKDTFANIEAITARNNANTLLAGSASIEITPEEGVALGGYSSRDPKSNEGVLHNIFAKAITIDNGLNSVTLLSVEILLPVPGLIDAILDKTQLTREQIYFTATHTHSGIGAYGHGVIPAITLGEFQQKEFNFLSEKISQVILASRKELFPVEIHYRRVELTDKFAENFIVDQLNDPPKPHNSLHLLEFINTSKNESLATLVTFSAHPTFLGRRNKRISGDYAGLLMQRLEEKLPGIVLFSSGATGGMLPRGYDTNGKSIIEIEQQKLEDMTERLSQFLLNLINDTTQQSQQKISTTQYWNAKKAVIHSEVIPIQLPSATVRLNNAIRLSPLFVEQIFHKGKTFIHALRLGRIVFLGYPADYSGESAQKLETWAADKNVLPWATSFNGDYIGYIMPTHHYDKPHYTVQDMSIYGRWSGDYFTDISQRAILTMFPQSTNIKD